MAYVPRAGPVPVHPWLLTFRFLQCLSTVLVIATTAYSLSIDGGGPLKAPLVSTIVVAILTLLPILPLTTPIHVSQCRFYDPRIALSVDLVAALFWLASFAALASYLDIFHEYGKNRGVVDDALSVCTKCRGAWKSGVAAAFFAAIEFVLFLFTTLAFVYYYHCHLAHEPAYGISERKSEPIADGTTYGIPYSSTVPATNSIVTETPLKSPSHTMETRIQSPMSQHTPMIEPHGAGHVAHPVTSGFEAFGAHHNHPPTPHPHTANYGEFRTSHPPTSGYAAPPAVGGGASPIMEEREGAVSPPLPPRSPSRLEGRDSYVFESLSHAGAGADTTVSGEI